VLEDNILFVLLIGSKSFHSYILSDAEANRCRIFFRNLIKKSDACHEAYFGLAKIYYHLKKYEYALEHVRKAISNRPHDYLYLLWKGLILYFLLISKSEEDLASEKTRVKGYLSECEEALMLSVKLNKTSNTLATHFILMRLSIFMKNNKSVLKT